MLIDEHGAFYFANGQDNTIYPNMGHAWFVDFAGRHKSLGIDSNSSISVNLNGCPYQVEENDRANCFIVKD